MQLSKIVRKYKFTIICLIAIIHLCFMDMGDISTPNIFAFSKFDLFAHFSMYLGLTFIFLTEKQYKNENKLTFAESQKYLIAFIILGFLIEIFQPIISTRSRELFDFIADLLGCYAGYFVFVLFRKFFLKSSLQESKTE